MNFTKKIKNLEGMKKAISVYNEFDDLLDDDIADICSIYRAKVNQVEKQLNDIMAYPFVKVINYKKTSGNLIFKYYAQTYKNNFANAQLETKARFFENKADTIFVEAPQKVYDKLIQTSLSDRIFPAKSAETIRSILISQGKDIDGIINTKVFFGTGMTKLAEMMGVENPSIFKYEDWVKNVKLENRLTAAVETLENSKYFKMDYNQYSLNEILAMKEDYVVYPIQAKNLFTADLLRSTSLMHAFCTTKLENNISDVFPIYGNKKRIIIGYGDYKKLLAKSPKMKQLKVWDTEIRKLTTFEKLESMYKNTFINQYCNYPDFFKRTSFNNRLEEFKISNEYKKIYNSFDDEQKTKLDNFYEDISKVYSSLNASGNYASRDHIEFVAWKVFNKRFNTVEEKSEDLGYSEKYPTLRYISSYESERYIPQILSTVVTYKKVF